MVMWSFYSIMITFHYPAALACPYYGWDEQDDRWGTRPTLGSRAAHQQSCAAYSETCIQWWRQSRVHSWYDVYILDTQPTLQTPPVQLPYFNPSRFTFDSHCGRTRKPNLVSVFFAFFPLCPRYYKASTSVQPILSSADNMTSYQG
jgi:hypothetical protein